MKRTVIGALLAGVLLLGAGVFYVFSNLNSLVKQVIETAGTASMGTRVSVESVELKLAEGTASIHGFAVANPQGFSNASMLAIEELSVTLDLQNTSPESIAIVSVIARNPQLLYESRDNTSNLDVVNQRMGSSPYQASSEASAPPVQLSIDNLQIEKIRAALNSDLLQEPVDVILGDIVLKDLQGTPEDLAKKIADPLIRQLAINAATALVTATSAYLRENAGQLGEQLLEEATQQRENLEDKLRTSLDGSLEDGLDEGINKDVREGLGDLLKRD
jgi:hypothetical protein